MMLLLRVFVCVQLVLASPNWLCNSSAWSKICGEWAYSPCQVLGTDQSPGAVTWIGDHVAASRSWANYTVSVTMQLLDAQIGAEDNAGLLFRAKSISGSNNGGQQYYAGVTGSGFLQFGKMNNGWDELYNSPSAVCDAMDLFTLSVSAVGSTYEIYVNGKLVTTYTDNASPYSSGSVGLRDYVTTVLYTNLTINLV